MGRKVKASPDYSTQVLAPDNKPYPWSVKNYLLYLNLERMRMYGIAMMKKSDIATIDRKYFEFQEESGYYTAENGFSVHNEDPTREEKVYLPNNMFVLSSLIVEDSLEEAEKTINSALKNLSKTKKYFLDPKYSRIARSINDVIEVHDHKNGNFIEANAAEPYIAFFAQTNGGSPKIYVEQGEKQWNRTIDGLGEVYDMFMEYEHDCMEQIKLQYERQEMERTGMNGVKEQTYKDKLYALHKKTIEDFDKLLAVEDHGQYDQFLNNELYHDLRAKLQNSRDKNYAIGVLKGECRAIENGWGYKDLKALGFIGGIVERFNAFERDSEPEHFDPAKNDFYAAKAEFEELKASIWDKPAPTNEEKIDYLNKLNGIIDKYKDSSIGSLVRNVNCCRSMADSLKKEYQDLIDIENIKLSNGLNPEIHLNSTLNNKSIRAFAEEYVMFFKRKASIEANNDASEEDKAWAGKLMEYDASYTDRMSVPQRIAYYKALNEYQTDLQIAVSLHAERIEKEIEAGKIEGLGDLKDDPVVRGLVAERIALRTTEEVRKLEAITDLVVGIKMEYEGLPFTNEEFEAAGDPSITGVTDLFGNKAKDKYIQSNGIGDEFRCRTLMARENDINRKAQYIEEFGLKVDENGKCRIKNQDLYNESVQKRAAKTGEVLKTYNDKLTDMISQACQTLTELSDMKVKPGKDSAEFTNMREALIKVSELGTSNTPAEINQALFDLKVYSDEYIKNRTSSASNRREKAAQISGFANDYLNDYDNNFGREILINKTVSDQMSNSINFSNKNLSEEQKENANDKIDRLKGYMNGFNEFYTNLYRRFDNMKVNKDSDSKQFTAMREALEKLGSKTADNTVKDIADALSNLRKTSAAYISKIEVQGGGKSINGGKRLDFAKELFNLSIEKTKEFNEKTAGRLDVNKTISEQGFEPDNIIIVRDSNINRQPSNVKELQQEEGIKENNKVVNKANVNKSKDINKSLE